jgi:hypothetical protein
VRLHRRTVERVRVKLSSLAPAASSRQRRRLFELGLRAGRRGVPNQGIRAQRAESLAMSRAPDPCGQPAPTCWQAADVTG